MRAKAEEKETEKRGIPLREDITAWSIASERLALDSAEKKLQNGMFLFKQWNLVLIFLQF